MQRVKESKAPFLKQSRIYFTFDLHNMRRLCDCARAAKLRNYVSVEIILTTLVHMVHTCVSNHLIFYCFNYCPLLYEYKSLLCIADKAEEEIPIET